MPRAAAAVLPMILSSYDICVQLHPVPSASVASLCRLTPALLPPLVKGLNYLATMSPLLYWLVYTPATQASIVAISLHRTFPSLRMFPGFGVIPGSPNTLISGDAWSKGPWAELHEPFCATLLAMHASFMEIRERFATDLHAATASFNF
ncbi:hypothetical protein B0H17DRAFT_1214442 [Mycena rosella]|uniref:Uncharacterized protein n=1 Tax=Mycena rosella TaxID=1033263 RepID=A0AAD7G0V0_MYCRO|nr:hypothetical protein B0H17DRAFT_1214442 [Mycena rosella]